MPDNGDPLAQLLERTTQSLGPPVFSVAALLQRAAAVAPNGAALVEPGRESLLFPQLLALAARTVAALNSMGFSPQTRVALALPTSVETGAAYLCVMAGLPIAPLNPDLPAAEYVRYLTQTRSHAVIVQQGHPTQAREAASRLNLPLIELRFAAGGPVGSFEIVGAPQPTTAPRFAGPDDGAVVLPTSGTTGSPRLVPRTQRQVALDAYCGHLLFHTPAAPEVLLNLRPLHHAGGFNPLLRALAARISFACAAGSIGAAYRLLGHYRRVGMPLVPPMMQALVDEAPAHAAELARLDLQRIYSVSAELGEPLLLQAQSLFKCEVDILYGMTEIYWIAAGTREPAAPATKPGAVGRPLPYTEVRICDESGAELLAGQVGEIAVRSPLLFGGYEDDAAANRGAFTDGWFRTGDSGYLDADGYLYLAGRVKELINRGGSKVVPADVDAVLLQHPAVADAATFGVPHSETGEDVAAAIVLRAPGATERELRGFAAARMALYKVPRRFVFVDEIPRDGLGKISRNALRERFAGQLAR